MAPTLQRWPHGGGPPRDLGEQGLSQGKAGAGLGDGVISSLAPYRLSWPVAHRFGLLLPPESRVGLWAPGSADPQRQVRRGWASGREPFALGGMCCTQNAALISAPATAGITSSPTPALLWPSLHKGDVEGSHLWARGPFFLRPQTFWIP